MRRWGQARWWDHPPPTVLADPVLLPPCRHAEGTASCSRRTDTQRMQRAVTRAHARWVSWLRGLRRRLQTADGPGWRAGFPPALLGQGEPRGQLRLRGGAQEPQNSCLHRAGGESSRGFMLSICASSPWPPLRAVTPDPAGVALPAGLVALPALAASPQRGHHGRVPGRGSFSSVGGSSSAPHAAAAPVELLWVPSLQPHLPCPHASPRGTPRCPLGPRAAPPSP